MTKYGETDQLRFLPKKTLIIGQSTICSNPLGNNQRSEVSKCSASIVENIRMNWLNEFLISDDTIDNKFYIFLRKHKTLTCLIRGSKVSK